MNNQLVKVIYGEASQEERQSLFAEMEINFELKEEYEQLLEAKNYLDGEKKSPHPTSVKIILEHSRKKCPEHTV